MRRAHRVTIPLLVLFAAGAISIVFLPDPTRAEHGDGVPKHSSEAPDGGPGSGEVTTARQSDSHRGHQQDAHDGSAAVMATDEMQDGDLAKALRASADEPVRRLELIRETVDRKAVAVAPDLVDCLDDANALVRIEAIDAVAALADDDASVRTALRQRLSDPHPRVVQRTLQVMSARGLVTIEMLEEVILRNRQREDGFGLMLRTQAVQALGRVGDPRSGVLLIDEYAAEDDPQFRDAVIEALGRTGADGSTEFVRAHLDTLLGSRPEAAIALGPWERSVAIARTAIEQARPGG